MPCSLALNGPLGGVWLSKQVKQAIQARTILSKQDKQASQAKIKQVKQEHFHKQVWFNDNQSNTDWGEQFAVIVIK